MTTTPNETVDLNAIRSALEAWTQWRWSAERNHIATVMNAAPALVAELAAARAEIDRLKRLVVLRCLESRKLAKDIQAAGLRDELLTEIDPHMIITQRIREDAEATTEGGFLKPAPGSDVASTEGCVCPVIDNHYGRGYGGDGAKYGWVTDSRCPLHRSSEPANPTTTTTEKEKR